MPQGYMASLATILTTGGNGFPINNTVPEFHRAYILCGLTANLLHHRNIKLGLIQKRQLGAILNNKCNGYVLI